MALVFASIVIINAYIAGIVEWLERWTHDQEVKRGSSPAGAVGEFSSPGSAFCALFDIRTTPVLP